MLGTFFGLNIASLGLQANNASIEVTANNVSNANTPGYSRQVAELATTPSIMVNGQGPIPVQAGSGVQVDQITRERNSFLDTQYRQENSTVGQWTAVQNTMNQIQAIVNEPSSTGLSSVMQNFWVAWSQMGSNPGSLSAAQELQQNAAAVTSTLNQMGTQYSQLQSDLQTQLSTNVDQANSYLSQIASVDQQIQNLQSTGGQPNDLLDRRDQLVDKLSNIVDVKTSTDQYGIFHLTIGSNGTPAINGSTQVGGISGGTMALPSTVTAANTMAPTDASSGQLKGLEDSIAKVTQYSGYLNTFASTLANGPTDASGNQGTIPITLAGDWQFPAPSGGASAATFPVSGTLPDGTKFSKGQSISGFLTAPTGKPADVVTVDSSVTPPLIKVPAGTTVNVNGLNGLLQLGYAQDGEVSPSSTGQTGGTDLPNLFVASGGTSATTPITASNISVGVNAGQLAYALRPTVATSSSGTGSTWSSSNPGLSGDGTLAISASDMKTASVNFASATSNPTISMSGTFDEFLQSEVGQLGIDSQQANNEVTNQNSLLQQVDQKRQSVSGVSIDQEMTNMIEYQQAYTASAKMINTINSMLNTLINGMGIA